MYLTLPWPGTTRLPLIDVGNTGMFVAPALLEPEKYNGKRFTSATAYYRSDGLVDALSKATQKEVKYVHGEPGEGLGADVPPEIVRAAKEVSGLMTDLQYYGPTGPEDLEWTLAQLRDEPTSWECFVENNGPWLETE